MKRICIIIVFVVNALTITAQENGADSLSIDGVMNACIRLRDAVATNDSISIHQSAEDLRTFTIGNFNELRCKDDTVASLNGHLVFDENFADSILTNRDAFLRSDEINRDSEAVRGQNRDGSIRTKTCFVKAGASTKYTFLAKGYQELAVVAEAGGFVTMKIHVTNSAGLDEHYDDTKDVTKGRSHRKTSFDLPTNKANTVELEVLNCCGKDISFVVICN